MKSDQIKLPVGGVHIPPIRDRQTTIRNSPLFLLALCLGSALFFVMLTGHSHFGHPESNNKHGHKLKLSPEGKDHRGRFDIQKLFQKIQFRKVKNFGESHLFLYINLL